LRLESEILAAIHGRNNVTEASPVVFAGINWIGVDSAAGTRIERAAPSNYMGSNLQTDLPCQRNAASISVSDPTALRRHSPGIVSNSRFGRNRWIRLSDEQHNSVPNRRRRHERDESPKSGDGNGGSTIEASTGLLAVRKDIRCTDSLLGGRFHCHKTFA
jgi:hypothetical protein